MKKYIAFVCALAMLISFMPLSVLPARAAEESGNVAAPYQVGYAKVDLNPYVAEDDPSSGVMALPLRGYGSSWERLSTDGLIDDSGDGLVDQNDGLKATCIAISDAEGNAILLYTIDMLGGTLGRKARPIIAERVNAALQSGELTDLQPFTEDHIHISGTHTHSSIASNAYTSNGKTGTNAAGEDLSVSNENLGIWIDRTLIDLGDAAIEALKDRAAAKVSKDQLSVGDATAPVLQGKRLNSIRHYNMEVDGDTFVGGNGFNAVDKWDYENPEDYRTPRGVDPKVVSQVDDNIYILRFDFPETEKLPVLMASWRGHPSMNGGTTDGRISSDYVNSFRLAVEYGCDVTFDSTNGFVTGWTLGTTRKYRAAFFQGTGGNVNVRSDELITYPGSEGDVVQYANEWLASPAYPTGNEAKSCTYGVVLAQLALECVSDGLNETEVENGSLRTMQMTYYAPWKTSTISQLGYEAALDYQVANAIKTVGVPYTYTSPETGEIFLISSKYHANNLVSRWNLNLNAPKVGTDELTLNAITMGDDVAFLTMPGEAFDYYTKDTSLTGDALFAPENNLWNDLVDDTTYGKPFVLGYCDVHEGYFPNQVSFDYNKGSTKWANGSYETHVTSYERGTGETMVRLYDQMLTALTVSDGDMSYTGACAHCGENQLWQPYTAQTALTTGHYYLCSDVHTATIKISGGQTVCIDLKGNTLFGESRAITTADSTKDILNIMDSSPEQTGVLQGCGALYGAARGLYSGTINLAAGDELNLYSGTLTAYQRTAYSACRGGVLYIGGTFNMYGGKVTGGTASSFTGSYYSSGVATATRNGYGGCIYNAGTCNFFGGTVTGGSVTTITGTVTETDTGYTYSQEEIPLENRGDCVWSAAAAVVYLSGDAQVDHLRFADDDGLNVVGIYTGAAEVEFNSLTELPDDTVVGNADATADTGSAHITFTDAPGKTAAVKGSDLVISDSSYTYGNCESCGLCQWIPVTDADLDAFGSYDMPPGHYRLTEDVTTNQKSLNKNGDHAGTFCVDLAGYTFSGSTRGFLPYEGATLNIMDSVGGGVVEGCGTSAVAGGGIYVTKNSIVNLYGGTVRSNPVNSETRSAGGAVTVNGGAFNMYGGTVEGSSVTGNGGAIQVKSGYDVPGTFTATGGQVIAGTAAQNGNCVYVEQGGNVVLSGDAKVDEISFYESSADILTVSGNYTGTVALKYPETEELTDLTDIGNSMDGDVSHASISFTDAPGQTAAVKGSDLVISDVPYSFATCQVCGECQWLPLTQADMKAVGENGLTPGHYRLTEDMTVAMRRLNKNGDHAGTYCIDLAGHTYTGTSRPFTVYSGAELNIFDTVGGGAVDGKCAADSNGSAIYLYSGGVAALYGGTLRHNADNTVATGGVVCAAGGHFSIHGGTVEGTAVTGRGGAISVSASGSFTATGGQVTMGTADTAGPCVYAAKGCAITLSGAADIAQITFNGIYAEDLCIDGGYTGSTKLSYPASVLVEVGTVIGSISPAGDLSNGNIAVDATCKTVVASGDSLVIADQHNYQSVITAPTCTEVGYTTYICDCGASYVSDEVAAAGHRYETVTVNATCTEEGSVIDTCSVCGDTQVQTIPATGHNYEAVVTAPGCTEAGYTTYTCACGDSYVADEVAAVGHSYSGGVCTTCDACEHCGDCQWVLISEAELENLQPGHYRLSEGIGASQQQLTTDGTYCIDLAGYTFTGASRAFYLGTGAILNIMDSIGGGVVEGKSGASVTGGVIYIYSSATVNLYGGTLRHNTQNSETVTTGGVVCVSGGTFNMYNGTVEGANVTGYGGAIMVSSRAGLYGTVTVSGGKITKGTAGSSGDCVYLNAGCKIVLTGNAIVEDIRFASDSVDALEIVGIYTGTTVLRYSASAIPTDGTDIGNAENADISAAVITVANAPCMKVGVSGTDLVVNATHSYEAVVTAPTCTEDGYTTYTCATCGDTKVEVISATGHSFVDGICTVCGEADPDYVKPVVQPTLTLKAPALEFKDMVKVIAFFTAENIEDVVEMGMITYGEKVDVIDVNTAAHVIPGAILEESTGRYFASSQGINAKYLGDTVYLACYAKLSDGSYVYTKLASYGAVQYATSQLKNSTDVKLKQLVVAMLNYGAAAQNYFGYNTDALANATLTAEQLALPESYTSDMVQSVPAADAAKQGIFANNKGFSLRKPAVSFEGAFSINYFFTPAYTPVDGITLYYWTEADFNAVDALTVDNATGALAMTAEADGQYRGDITDIAAKNVAQAVYVAAVYSDGTTTWTSGVLGYSIGAYCASQATKGGTIADLAMATAVYGYHAKQYFG